MEVGFKPPTSRSRVRLSTTEPPCSLNWFGPHQKCYKEVVGYFARFTKIILPYSDVMSNLLVIGQRNGFRLLTKLTFGAKYCF